LNAKVPLEPVLLDKPSFSWLYIALCWYWLPICARPNKPHYGLCPALSVCPCALRVSNSKTKRLRETKIGVTVFQSKRSKVCHFSAQKIRRRGDGRIIWVCWSA